MIPYQNKIPADKKNIPEKLGPLARSAYLLFSGAISTLIALLSLLTTFAFVSLLTAGAISGITIPEKTPNWGAAVILLVAYTIIVLPLKSLRFRFSPHKEYSLYGGRPAPKYGDATLWLALFILLVWYVSENRAMLSSALGNFPDWWRNFVDMIGPWFYR